MPCYINNYMLLYVIELGKQILQHDIMYMTGKNSIGYISCHASIFGASCEVEIKNDSDKKLYFCRRRNGFVVIAMEAMDQLLVACHAQTLNLFVESFLKMVQKLLESTDPQLQILATQSVSSDYLI